MNGQEPLLAGRSNLGATRQQIIKCTRRHSDPGKGGSFPQGGEHFGMRDAEETGWRMGKHVGQNNFRPDDDGGQLASRIFILEGCHKSLEPLWVYGSGRA